jgi:hypothetical protein
MTTTTQVFTFVNQRVALTSNPSLWVLSSLVIVYLIHHMTYGAPRAPLSCLIPLPGSNVGG